MAATKAKTPRISKADVTRVVDMCSTGRRWFRRQPSAYRAWMDCDRPGWLLWSIHFATGFARMCDVGEQLALRGMYYDVAAEQRDREACRFIRECVSYTEIANAIAARARQAE
jgi:hypothetical protein